MKSYSITTYPNQESFTIDKKVNKGKKDYWIELEQEAL